MQDAECGDKTSPAQPVSCIMNRASCIVHFLVLLVLARCGLLAADDRLEGTRPLTLQGDIASKMIEGIDRFLLRKTKQSIVARLKQWQRDLSSAAAYNQSVSQNRQRLAHILGVRDQRVPFDAPELVATVTQPALVGAGQGYQVFSVRWPAIREVYGEGLLLVPIGRDPVADIVAVPDADLYPEQLAGLVTGVPRESQYARRLAESGCRVIVPTLVDRRIDKRQSRYGGWSYRMSNREFLHRPAFVLGRHMIGYELQKVFAAVDWFQSEGHDDAQDTARRVGVIGWGEGGLISLYAAALDTRIDAACVSGYFDSRQRMWQEPLERNVFGLLDQFGDAEVASLVAPRTLVVEAARGPQVKIPAGLGAAPGKLVTPRLEDVQQEVVRARKLVADWNHEWMHLVSSGNGTGPYAGEPALQIFLTTLVPGARLAQSDRAAERLRAHFDPQRRQQRAIDQIDRHNQWLLAESPYVRAEFMKRLDTTALDKFKASTVSYREYFREQIVGNFPDPKLPPNPRTRKAYETEHWSAYEVVLDVYPDVIAYGLLLVPKDIPAGKKPPLIVCQHGLETTPRDVIGKGKIDYYHGFGARLAERGYVIFAPQNLYRFQDRFRVLQRKANPIKKTLFSIIVPQHQQIVDWLTTLSFVDSKRVALYGLSYGGKTVMRVVPLVAQYRVAICSADFSDYVQRNVSTQSPYSYVFGDEYEIFEFDLASTFNYAEMAALIAPRPFMVERGHADPVTTDKNVASEFAKVRNLYQAQLKIPDACRIEWFDGSHEIHGQGTFEFLRRHLDGPGERD